MTGNIGTFCPVVHERGYLSLPGGEQFLRRSLPAIHAGKQLVGKSNLAAVNRWSCPGHTWRNAGKGSRQPGLGGRPPGGKQEVALGNGGKKPRRSCSTEAFKGVGTGTWGAGCNGYNTNLPASYQQCKARHRRPAPAGTHLRAMSKDARRGESRRLRVAAVAMRCVGKIDLKDRRIQ